MLEVFPLHTYLDSRCLSIAKGYQSEEVWRVAKVCLVISSFFCHVQIEHSLITKLAIFVLRHVMQDLL